MMLELVIIIAVFCVDDLERELSVDGTSSFLGIPILEEGSDDEPAPMIVEEEVFLLLDFAPFAPFAPPADNRFMMEDHMFVTTIV